MLVGASEIVKIAVISDSHFGYAHATELEQDSFDNAEEAIDKAMSMEADMILLAGDIFDSRLPRTGVWARAIRILVKPLLKKNNGLQLVSSTKELEEISKRSLQSIPIVAIHGTHERRGRDETNAVEALEHAGILIHLHCDSVVFEKAGRKVAVHGMSGVAERYAKSVLDRWNPQPVDDAFNILMIHQSISPYVYSPLEPPTLSLSNLPKGFNVILDGHIHATGKEKINGTHFIVVGSTVTTQLEKNEAEASKGFYIIEFDDAVKIDFVPLQKNRKFFFEEIKLSKDNLLTVGEQIEKKIDYILSNPAAMFAKKPLIKIKIIGGEHDVMERDLRHMEKKYADAAIVRFVKQLGGAEMEKKIELLRNVRDQKLSAEEIGIQILKKNLDAMSFEPVFDYNQAFDLLSDEDVEKMFDIITGEQTTLTQALKKPMVL